MIGRSPIFLLCLYIHIFNVDCASEFDYLSSDDAFDYVLDYGNLYATTSYPDTKIECYDGRCEPFEICREEEDEDSGETFAMCECVEGDDRCDHHGISTPASQFDALAVERFVIQQRSGTPTCTRKCRFHEVCLSIRGDEICVPKRTCDKESKPCHNGGTCHTVGNGGSACRCPQSFYGDRCEVDMAVCSPTNPCATSGECVIVNGTSKCNCPIGYHGKRCELESRKPNLCGSELCPSGQCREISPMGFVCIYGPCDWIPQCSGHGYCWITSSGQNICECESGWRGGQCEDPTDPCLSNPCPIGQSCTTTRNRSGKLHYSCIVDPCLPNPCKGDCECKASCKHEGGYFCHGSSGLLGRNCDIPAPKVSCGADAITIGVNSTIVQEYSGGMTDFVMFMSQFHSIHNWTGCTATENAGFFNFSIPLPFTKCGVIVKESSDVTRVSGKIWLNRFFGRAEMAIPVAEFICRYQKQYRVVTSLVPARNVWRRAKETQYIDNYSVEHLFNSSVEHLLNDLPNDDVLLYTEHGILRGSATMELCKSGRSCPQDCPKALSLHSGALYTINERMHLRIMPRIKGAKLRLNDLYLSCSADPAQVSAEVVDLVTKSCMPVTTSHALKAKARNAGGGVCVSFRAPLLRKCSQFYIHARLDECDPKCDTTYRSCTKRRKRSVESDQENVYGPIYILDAHDGVLESVVHPGDNDIVDAVTPSKTVPARPRHTKLLIVLTAVTIGTFVILSLLFAFYQRSSQCGKSFQSTENTGLKALRTAEKWTNMS